MAEMVEESEQSPDFRPISPNFYNPNLIKKMSAI